MNLARRERAVACPAVPRSRLRGTGVAKRVKRVCGTGVEADVVNGNATNLFLKARKILKLNATFL